MKNISKLEIGYYIPVVTIAEIAAILITILIQPYSVSGLLNNIKQAVTVATILMLVILLVMLAITIKYQRGNSFRNYCSSVVQTYNLRKFSKVQPKTTQVKVGNEWKNQPINDPVERAFNQALQGWYIDKRKNSLIVWLFLPKLSSATNKLDQELPNILDNSGAIEWAYINHNHDQAENGEPIREHFHIVLKYEYPQTITSIAQLFNDDPQYVQVWHGRINNAYSYLIHETQDAESADGKYHYATIAVKASFDYPKRLEQIRAKIKHSPKYENEQIRRYAEQAISRDQLTQELGVYGMARHQQLIDKIDAELLAQKHQEWLKKFKGHKMTTLWLYGKAGVGKTRLAEHIFQGKDYITLGSSRDHFQEYRGQRFVIINDLRPNDFEYSDLLRLLDPYQHDKAAPSRYHDKRLNLEKLIITTPYDPMTFYCNINSINDMAVDSANQLMRRIKPIKVTDQMVKTIRRKVVQRNKKASHTNQDSN